MSDSPAGAPISASLDLKDYVEAATEAARGTRVVTIVLVVACVLVFIGFWNSFQWSWTHERLDNTFDPEDPTIYGVLHLEDHPAVWPSELHAADFKDPLRLAQKLSGKESPVSAYLNGSLSEALMRQLGEGARTDVISQDLRIALAAELNALLSSPYLYNEERFRGVTLSPSAKALAKHRPEGGNELKRLNRLLLEDAYPNEIERSYKGSQASEFRKELMQSGVRSYVENVRFVKAPFFGIAFDVNDLGLIGGIGFIIILLLLRHSLSREVKSLNKSFKEARRTGMQQFIHFYHILAMKLVFTLPEMEGEQRNRLLALSVKLVCLMPSLVFLLAVTYDWVSVVQLGLFVLRAVWFQLATETALMGVIGYLSYRCWKKLEDIDDVWDENWRILKGERYGLVVLDGGLVEEFGTDDLVNDALRRWREGKPYGNTGLSTGGVEATRLDASRSTKGNIHEARVRSQSKLKFVLLLFASLLLLSTAFLLGIDRGIFKPTSDTSPWVVVFTAVVSALGTISTAILAWRSDRRDARERALKITQLERELEAERGKSDPNNSKNSRK